MLHKLEEAGVRTKTIKISIREGNLNGQTFLFTGTLKTQAKRGRRISRKKWWEDFERGEQQTLLPDSGRRCRKQAGEGKKIPGIRIISEEDFLKMVLT